MSNWIPMLDLAERRSDASNWIEGDLGLWIKENVTNLEKQMNEQEQFHKRASAAIYLQGVLLAKLGIDRDTTRVNDDIMASVDALKVASKAPCCHVVAGAEGTSYCGLAENAVLALRTELGEALRLQAHYKAALEKISNMDYRGNSSVEMSVAFEALDKAKEVSP